MNTKINFDSNTKNFVITCTLVTLTSVMITTIVAALIHKRVNDAHEDGWVEGYEEAKRDFQNDLKLQKKQYKEIIEELKNNENEH